MVAESAKLLVVSNPGDSEEICTLLSDAGFSSIAAGDGGDDTFALYEATEPDVVIVTATLDLGDAQALVSSMRRSEHGKISKVVLIGDADGPIRNALDAADFGVDRFVGRPLSPKALGFAVRSCAETAAFHRESLAVQALVEGEPASPADVPSAPERDSGAVARAPMFRAMKTPKPFLAEEVGRKVEKAVDLAIEDFVTDAIDALGDLVATDPLMTQTSADVPDAWQEPPPPAPREPTLILSGGGAAPPPAEPARIPQDGEPSATEHHADAGSTDRQLRGSSFSEVSPTEDRHVTSDMDDLVDQLPDELGDDFASDLADEFGLAQADGLLDEPAAGLDSDEQAVEAMVTNPATASGGMFARELRRKMSQMAERLFPGHGEKESSFDGGVAHGHKTEIDLTSIGVDSAARLEARAPYDDIAAEETFPDAPEPVSSGAAVQGVSSSEGLAPSASMAATSSPVSVAEADETTARRVASSEAQGRGQINLLENDVATLIAKLFNSKFTGRVTFRRSQTEKSIHFDQGRPVFATSNLPHDRMGDLLFREGKITRGQHARSRELVVESGRRMGEILVEMGFLKRRELLPAVRRHIEDIIYSMFSWDAGEFIVAAGDLALHEKIRLSRHPAALILEGVRRKYDEETLAKRLGSGTTIVAIGEPGKLNPIVAAADLSRAERMAIAGLDGEKSLEQVAAAAEVALLTVYQLAFGLTILGVAEVVRRGDEDDLDVDSVRPPTLVGETDLAIDRQRVTAKYALVGESDYFSLLGVRRDASTFEIKRAYESARRDYASESFPAEVRSDLDAEIEEINELLEEAFRVLRNESLRASYLAHLRD